MIIKNKTTGESKGLGYVRYYKPSQAALAIENCDKSKRVSDSRWGHDTETCVDIFVTHMSLVGDSDNNIEGDGDFVISLQGHPGWASH